MIEENQNDSPSQVLLALCYSNKFLGLACYDELSNTLYADSISVSTGTEYSLK
jgi:hypothetical protein